MRADGHYPVNRNIVIAAGQPALEAVDLRVQTAAESGPGAPAPSGTSMRPVTPAMITAGAGIVLIGVGLGVG